MNAELDANPAAGVSGGARPASVPKPPRRSLVILAILALIALGLMILPRPALYYPHVVIEVVGAMELDFLLDPRQDKAACQAAASNVAVAITTSCQECRTRESSCLKNPSQKIRSRFDEAPMPVPSARMANGVVTFIAAQPEIALQACRESERQAVSRGDNTKVACYPAGSPRPRTPFELGKAEAGYNAFTLLLAGMGALIAGIIGAVFVAHRRIAGLTQEEVLIANHPWLEKFTLAGVDTLILLGTFLVFAWPDADNIDRWSRVDRSTVISHGIVVFLTIGWFWIVLEHYARRRPFWDELRETMRVLAIMTMMSGATAFVSGLDASRASLVLVWALNFLLIPLGRAAIRQILDDLGLWKRPAVIIGTGENARDAWLAIRGERNMGYRILGFARAGGGDMAESLVTGDETFPILDTPQSVEAMLASLGKPQAILALDSLADPENQTLVQRLLATCANVHVIPPIRGIPLFGAQLSHFFSHEVLFLSLRNNLSRRSLQWFKRSLDIAGATVLLVVLSPLMAYVAWRIWREDGSPVIFRQPRLAKSSGEFGFLKFRSMVKDADGILAKWRETDSPEWREYHANNFKLKNDPRVLGVGSWIRSTSIDELPQLINVLRGEMSLVGPRPLLGRELTEYGSSISYYRQARPGITGIWQISGRSQTKFNDRAMLDEWYVQNWSLWYDIAILFKTIDVVVGRRGAH